MPFSSTFQSPSPIFQRKPLSSALPVATKVASIGLQATPVNKTIMLSQHMYDPLSTPAKIHIVIYI